MKTYNSFEDLQAAWSDICEQAERCLSQENSPRKIGEFILGFNQDVPKDVPGKSCDCELHHQDDELSPRTLPRE